MRTSPLSLEKHGICIGIGFCSLFMGIIIKAILPVSLFERLHMKEEVMSDEEEKQAFTSTFRKSFRQSTRRSANLNDM